MTTPDLDGIRERSRRAATCTLSDIDSAQALDLEMTIGCDDAPALLAEVERLTSIVEAVEALLPPVGNPPYLWIHITNIRIALGGTQ